MALTNSRDRNKILRRLYIPWAWLVFIPYLAFSTLVWGVIAVIISTFSPKPAFHCGTIWSRCLCWINFTRIELTGREYARKGCSYIIMSNHQSHFDILAFYGHWGRQFRWVLKEELRNIPGLGWYCAAGGHIFIDRSSQEKAVASLKAAQSLLEGGISVMIFPEGTRSTDGRIKEFKKGGFMLALDLGLPILPVSISGSRHVLPNRTLDLFPGRIRITVHPPIDTTVNRPDKRDRLREEVREVIMLGLTENERDAGIGDEE
jgi:1-acyl-sn-glycerol-3-phosphate acyltransferase